MDSVIVIGGCDKTLPAQVMAAISADLRPWSSPWDRWLSAITRAKCSAPATDCRRLWGKYRAGEIDDVEIEAVNGRLAPSVGTCMVMGTASTMACMIEAMGLSLADERDDPGTACRTISSCGGERPGCGRDGQDQGPKPSEVLTAGILQECASRAAIDRRLDQRPDPSQPRWRIVRRTGSNLGVFDQIGREVPVWSISSRPRALHGAFPPRRRYAEIAGAARRSHRSRCEDDHGPDATRCRRQMQKTCPARTRSARAAIRSRRKAAFAVLHGNLAPRGAVIKQSAASAKLLQHTGRAVVFESVEDMTLRVG